VSKQRSAPPSCQSSLPRAHYQLVGASVDITDLLNSDFELVELLEQAIANLGMESTARSVEELFGYAEQVLTLILDLQTDRTVELIIRLTSAAAGQNARVQTESKPVTGGTVAANRRVYAAYTELNRLNERAQSSDYACLKPGGRDKFSGMRLHRLAEFIPAAVWIEMQIRLRAAGLLTP
jgi:hypothetical protein